MTANQDLYAAAQAAIETRRALVAAGTPGPWTAHLGPLDGGGVGFQQGLVEAPRGLVTSDLWAPNARLITAAVNALPADTEALAAGLARHALFSVSIGLGVRERVDQSCRRCSRPWPCPDALAALTALGVAPC